MFTKFARLTVLRLLITLRAAGLGKGDGDNTATKNGKPLPIGHMKPFGSHMPAEGSIDRVNGFLEPDIFYEKYVRASRPVLFKQAATGIPAFHLWTDRYLSERYGKQLVDVEEGKKENRSQGVLSIPLKQFVESYTTENIYMVQDVIEEMKGDLSLPKSLWCGGFQDALELGVIWFSSGGTKSVLHYDSVDNINCLMDGEKTIKFVDKKHQKRVEAYGFKYEGSYSLVDVESVDLLQYPTLQHVPWWTGKMEKGDCLFIPQRWYHTVDSAKSRNLAVNLWFVHMLWFNKTDCDIRKKEESQIPEYDTLENYDLSIYNKYGGSIEKIRSDVFETFEGLPEVTIEAAIAEWGRNGDEADVQAMFEMIDGNKDMTLSWEEIYKSDILALIMDFPYILSDISPEELEALQEAYPAEGTEEGPDDLQLRDEL